MILRGFKRVYSCIMIWMTDDQFLFVVILFPNLLFPQIILIRFYFYCVGEPWCPSAYDVGWLFYISSSPFLWFRVQPCECGFIHEDILLLPSLPCFFTSLIVLTSEDEGNAWQYFPDFKVGLNFNYHHISPLGPWIT